jgi:hypothetical protein
MSIGKTWIALIVVVGAALAAPMTAQAWNVETTFDGATTSLGSGGGCTGGIPQLGPSTGCYSFGGAVPASVAPTCTYQPDSGAQGSCSGTISSSGTYTNVQCGTGVFTGTANLSMSPWSIPSFRYTISFEDGVGVLNVDPGQTVSGSGIVEFQPVPANPPTFGCATTGASGFTILGTLFLNNGGVGSLPPGVPPELPPDLPPDLVPPDWGLPPSSSQPSAQCTSPTEVVANGTFGGVFLRLIVQQNGTSSTWVCVRVPGSGGRLVVQAPGPGGGGTPSVDDNSPACRTSGNQAPGPHPLADGTLGGQQVYLDTWQDGAQTWVCVGVNGTNKRVILATPGVSLGSVNFEPDA